MKTKHLLFGLIISLVTISTHAQTEIFDKPVVVGFSGPSSAYVYAGENITLGVDVALNGSTITNYTWYLDNNVIGNGKTCNYTIQNTDAGKKIKVKIDSDKGTIEEEYKIILLENTFSAEKNTHSFPAGIPSDNTIFPVTVGQTFTNPVIDYTNGSTNTIYYVLKDGSTSPYIPGTTENITIPYLNQTFNCTVLAHSSFQSTIGVDKTFFLEPGTFEVTISSQGPFNYDGLIMVGSGSTEKSELKFQASANFRTYMNQKIIWENLIINGNNISFNQHFITYNMEKDADGLIMKNLLFKNIGNGGSSRSLFNFYEIEANRNYNVKRYFIDITVESASTSAAYDLININGADGIYFKNLNIQTTSGSTNSISITNGTETTAGCQNIVIDGLSMPANKRIRILRYSSRGISIPEEYRYLHLNTGWNPTSTTGYAIVAYKENELATSATYAYLDAKTNSYLVRNSLSTAIETQLTRINTLFGQTNTKNACTLPDPAIKLVGKPDGTDTIIEPFTIPSLNNIPAADTIHLIAMNKISNSPVQDALLKFKGHASNRIKINSTIANQIKLYNVDFSKEDLSSVYHATGVAYASSATPDKSTVYMENSFYSNTNRSFYNCLFKDFTGSPLGPLQFYHATLSGTPGICPGDLTATLNVSLGSYSNDGEVWTIKYKEKDNALAPVLTQTITLPDTDLTISPAPSTSTSYVLVSAESGIKTASVSGTGTVTIYDKMFAGSIEGYENVCQGVIPEKIKGTLPTGGSNIYTYQWQKSTDYTIWTNIPGAIEKDYTPKILTSTTYFRRIDEDAACGKDTTNTFRIELFFHEIPAITKELPNYIFECFKESYLLEIESTGHMLTYQWYFNDKPIEHATSHSYLATESGHYYVEIRTVCNDMTISNTCKLSFCDETGPEVQREVKILHNPYVKTTPPAEIITYVKGHDNFVFTMKAEPGYSLDYVTVKTGISRYDNEGIIYNRISADSAEVKIIQVTDVLAITIEGISPTDNEILNSQYKAWAHKGQLFIHIPEKTGIKIYTLTGLLYKQMNLSEGNTSIKMEKGAFIIVFENGIRQKIFIK